MATYCAPCRCPLSSHCGRGRGPFYPCKRAAHVLLYLQGMPADQIWYIETGTVALMRVSHEDQGLGNARALREAGSLIGLEALVADTYWDSARTETATNLCVAEREALDAWLGPPRSPARTALELQVRSEQQTVVRRAPTDGTAVQRVASWLIDQESSHHPIDLSRKVLADLLGMRSETLSRALSELSHLGAIMVSRTDLQVVDAELLRQLASRF